MTTEASRAGCSYFGVRIARHVRRDMADLAARGYTGVLHTFSENDLAYYRDTMRDLVGASHAAGWTGRPAPGAAGRPWGGGAETPSGMLHPEECRVGAAGRRAAPPCLNSPV